MECIGMSRGMIVLLIGALATTLACGGGGGDGVVAPVLVPSFVADPVDGDGGVIHATEDAVVGNTITIAIVVTGADDVYGAAFDLTYDPAVVTFEGWAPGALLEDGGHRPNYAVDAPREGVVVVGASRTGDVPGVDVSEDRTLIRLTFRARQPGSAPLAFRSASMTDSLFPPEAIAGLSWFGGTVVVV
jgi:hypothetical protein